ncbi:radical SAM protein [Tropicibacter sp. R15_0]|uniref:radical SAM protein n=1 Tax=Tropicibacter sp. R15_0 TaxID=2821101 RepID=UPI001ADCCD18|nr:radical SAM protein [Tropicibacter sp. R15_0]MBO9468452.1 radical SAM protein [Tropicibacter sp. R15_0]
MFDHRSGAKLSAPLHVEMAVTSSCQLNCNYCSAMPFSGALAPLERTCKIIAEMGEMRVHSLLLSGGEPTLHPGFLQIAAIASRAIPEVLINSNGIRLSRENYADSFHAQAPNSLVAISIDSADVAVNDLHRGAGGAQAIRAVRNLIEREHSVCISSVLTIDSFETAEQLIDLFFPDVVNFRFFPQVPTSEENRQAVQGEYLDRLDQFFARLHARSEREPTLKLHLPRKKAPGGGAGRDVRRARSVLLRLQ